MIFVLSKTMVLNGGNVQRSKTKLVQIVFLSMLLLLMLLLFMLFWADKDEITIRGLIGGKFVSALIKIFQLVRVL